MWRSRSCLVPKYRTSLRALACYGVLATLVLVAACSSDSSASSGTSPSMAVPTEVRCEDAAELTRHAANERDRASTYSSDQARLSTANGANFLASLGLVARLKCKVGASDGDAALQAALETARSAAAAGSFYEASRLWNDAIFHAAQAISALIEQLPADPVP